MSQDRAFLMDYTSFEGVEAQRPHLLARHLFILVNEVWPLCLNPVKYNVGPLCYNPLKKCGFCAVMLVMKAWPLRLNPCKEGVLPLP